MYNIYYFNFKESKKEYLLTNDFGQYIHLNKDTFDKFISKKLNVHDEEYLELKKKYFIYDSKEEFLLDASPELRIRKGYLFNRTQLHIFVLTNQCNLNCLYCQAESKPNKIEKMTKPNAKKFVDIALKSDSPVLSFEFQGGEPTLNFEILEYIYNYSQEENRNLNKEIQYNLVTNLVSISEKQIEFLLNSNINICTSIDGNEIVHNFNRPSYKYNSIEKTIKNLNLIREKSNYKVNVSAIQTTTKKSLRYGKEIVDTYIKLGFNNIFIRPLTPLGNSIKVWDKIGYLPDQFVRFYQEVLEYIITLNLKGNNFIESHTAIFLKKIIGDGNINYMELRSPCGASIGQLAYNYDGDIYSCDEARMLKEIGDSSFCVGNCNSEFEELLDNPVTKSLCASSCLEILPECSECVYQPYCGVCPVYNYIEQNNIFGRIPESYKCKIYKGMLEIIFNKLRDNKIRKVFEKWIGVETDG